MSEENIYHIIPSNLDNPGKFLFWDRDISFVALIGVFVGIGSGFPILGLIFGVGLAFLYGRLKTGKHPGFTTHLFYWWVGLPYLKVLPASYLRRFNG